MTPLREELGRAIAAVLRAGFPMVSMPEILPLQPGKMPGRGDWVCTFCLQAARKSGIPAQRLALYAALNLPLDKLPLAYVRAEQGFLNLQLADGWYQQTLTELARMPWESLNAEPRALRSEGLPADAARFLALAPDGARLERENPEWYLRRDRENPLYDIRYTCKRAGMLASRTDASRETDCLTPAYRRHVKNLYACAEAYAAQDAAALLGSLRRAAQSFRQVYEEEKPGFRAGLLAAATSRVLGGRLKALALGRNVADVPNPICPEGGGNA